MVMLLLVVMLFLFPSFLTLANNAVFIFVFICILIDELFICSVCSVNVGTCPYFITPYLGCFMFTSKTTSCGISKSSGCLPFA